MSERSRGVRVLALTQLGRDGELTQAILARAGIDCASCASLDDLLATMRGDDVGAVLIVEEVLADGWHRFAETLADQPPWSDLPVILFTMRYGPTIDRVLAELGGNVTVLERPLRSATVVSAVQSALLARRRQYEVRDLLTRQEELLGRLAENSRRKDEFLALLGHELRNPLSAIQNAVQLVHDDDGAPVSPRILEILDRQLRNLRRLVDDLLDVSRVTMGKIQLDQSAVDLTDLVSRCVQALAGDAALRRHRLTATVCEEALHIVGDQVRIEQVLANLVTNSIKFTPPGGSIEVALRRDGDRARIVVRDDGAGIAPDVLPRIFELFSQGKQTLDRAKGGLGLGLSLSRSLIERHGGTIEASSDGEGRGSEFRIALPLAALPIATPAVVATAEASAPTGLRVLVIEDNEDARESLIALLELWGHQATGAADGVAGLKLLLAAPPDVALVDIGLPELDGYEVARRGCAALGADRPRLVAMTGYGQPEDRQRALDAGFDVHIVKPVKPKDLEQVLRRGAGLPPLPAAPLRLHIGER